MLTKVGESCTAWQYLVAPLEARSSHGGGYVHRRSPEHPVLPCRIASARPHEWRRRIVQMVRREPGLTDAIGPQLTAVISLRCRRMVGAGEAFIPTRPSLIVSALPSISKKHSEARRTGSDVQRKGCSA